MNKGFYGGFHMTFKELFLAGEVEFDEIHKFTSKWNFSDDPRPLREYLGLNSKEEDVWVSVSDEALEEMMNNELEESQKEK